MQARLSHRDRTSPVSLIKHDILAVLGAAGLAKTGIGKDLAHRLIVLMLSRMNWATLEVSAAYSQLGDMWAVDQRRVKRILAELREKAIISVATPGVRGRATVYRISLAAVVRLTRPVWPKLGSDFVQRLERVFPATAPAPSGDDVSATEPTERPAQPAAEASAGPGATTGAAADQPLSGAVRTMGARAYDRWLRPLRVEIERTVARLRCPSAFFRDYVDRVYGDLIRAELRRSRPELDRVVFTT